MGNPAQFWTNGIRTVGLAVVALGSFGLSSAHAIILFRTADPAANTTAPSNDVAASGWNYEGIWGSYLGTPIAPHFFLSAAHIGQAGSNFVFQNVTYTIVTGVQDPFSDLNMWQVNETFPSYAPLYTRNDEVGQRIVAIGRGTRRGDPVMMGYQLRGWNWGGGDGVQRWGENVVANIIALSPSPNDFVNANFDENGLPNECHFSSGDSGGAVFINDTGAWKLAGINYGVDSDFFTDDMGHGDFTAAMFDLGGYYYFDGENYVQFPNGTPSGFYATRISSKIAWIESVIDPIGISNADNIPNLLEYAKVLNGPPTLNYGAPIFAIQSSSSVSLTYRKVINNPSLQYQLQQSTDLVHWQSATSQDTTLATNFNVVRMKSVVTTTPNQTLFLRLQVAQN